MSEEKQEIFPNSDETDTCRYGQAYLVSIAEKYGLYKHIRFNSTVEKAHWDASESKWKVSVKILGGKDSEFANSYLINSDFLISAVGQLNSPREPDIPGLKDFQGKMMHSARWDWSYGLSGKRIAVIGNGIYFPPAPRRERFQENSC